MHTLQSKKLSKKRLFSLVFSIFTILILGLFRFFTDKFSQNAQAEYQQNDSEGYFAVDFQNNQLGISEISSNVLVDVSNGIASLSGSVGDSGYFISYPIEPVSFSERSSVEYNASFVNSDDILVSVLDCSGNVLTGYDELNLSANELDIASLPAEEFSCIKIKTKLTRNESVTPQIDLFQVNRIPLAKYLLILEGNDIFVPGQQLSLAVKYSLSYVDDKGVVAFVELPSEFNGKISNFTTGYNQDLNMDFYSAQQNGLYTSVTKVVNGISVPANSVYRNLNDIEVGSNGVLRFISKLPAGIESGVTYSMNANIKGQNSYLSSSQILTGIVQSSPLPSLEISEDGFSLDGRVFFPTLYKSQVKYSLYVDNSPSASEDIFYPEVIADLSDIFAKLTGFCSVDEADLSQRVLNINNGGDLDLVNKQIVWSGDLMAVAAVSINSYTIEYSGCDTNGLEFTTPVSFSGLNMDTLSDSNTIKISTGFADPYINFSKNGSTSVYNGVLLNYGITMRNTGFPRLDKILVFDKIPDGLEFKNFIEPGLGNIEVFYHTGFSGNNFNNPPYYEYTDALNGNFSGDWTTTNPGTGTTWVAMFVDCLDSSYFPSTGACLDQITEFTANLTLKGDLEDECLTETKENIAYYRIYSGSQDPVNGDDSMVSLSPILEGSSSKSTTINPKIGSLNNTEILGSSTMKVGEEYAYKISVSNQGGGTLENIIAEYNIPQVNINGEMKYLPVARATVDGGSVDLVSEINSGKVIFTYPFLSVGQTTSGTIFLEVPTGIELDQSYDMSVSFKGTDTLCGYESVLNKTKSFVFEGEPSLQTVQKKDLRYIQTEGEIIYEMEITNNGETITKDTFVVSQIPIETKFLYAYKDGEDSNGHEYNCDECTVLFANNNPILPNNLTIDDPFVVSDFLNFVEGTLSGTVRISPFGEDTKYIAFKVEDSNGIFVQGDIKNMGYKVKDLGSESAAVISNYSAFLSKNILQSITNSVQTSIYDRPGININLHEMPSVLPAGEIFSVILDYYNDSDSIDSSFKLKIFLPEIVKLLGTENVWNGIAQNNGLTGVQQDILLNPAIATGLQATSGSRVELDVVNLREQELLGSGLQKLEGGTWSLDLLLDEGIEAGTHIPISVEGLAGNAVTDVIIHRDNGADVDNPDLYLRKSADTTNPVQGDKLHFLLNLYNYGGYLAKGISIQDNLDPGLCFVSGSTNITTEGWTSLDPIISGSCESGQNILWSGFHKIGYDTGILPAGEQIRMIYEVEIGSFVANGSDLYNNATAQTSIVENDTYDNTGTVLIHIPDADPAVEVNTPTQVFPGENFSYTISYDNKTRPSASGVYIIHKLPYFDGQDLDLIDILVDDGEEFYFNQSETEPIFDCQNPTDNAWTTGLNIYANYIAFRIGDLAGKAEKKEITIYANARDASTKNVVAPGTELDFEARIYSDSADEDHLNNVFTDTSISPGLDLTVEISASSEGAYPGTVPADLMVYNITYKNIGTELSCANTLSVNLYDDLVPDTVFHNFNKIDLVNEYGESIYPIGKNNIEITDNIAVTLDDTNAPVYKFLLGDATNTYEEVCIPAGGQQTIQIYAIVDANMENEADLYFSALVEEDWEQGIEYIMDNNSAQTHTIVYKADVKIEAERAGGMPSAVNVGDDISCKVTYDNIGAADAESVVIYSSVPDGSCFYTDSFETPIGTRLYYSDDNGISWDYVSAGGLDCDITDIKLEWVDSLAAQGLVVGEDSETDFNGEASAGLEIDPVLKLKGTFNIDDEYFYPWEGISNIYMVVAGDANNDGVEDFVVAAYGYSNKIYSWTGGERVFETLPGGENDSLSIGVGDVDDDGDNDIVVGNDGVNQLLTWEDGSWIVSEIGIYAGTTNDLEISDANNNGITDIVFVDGKKEKFATQYGSYMIEKIGTERINTDLPTHNATSLAVGDADNDGDNDIVVGCMRNDQVGLTYYYGEYNYIFAREGTGFVEQVLTGGKRNSYDINIGDANNDGLNDIVVGNIKAGGGFGFPPPPTIPGQDQVLIRSGDLGSWIVEDLSTLEIATKAIVLGDIDNDGDNDIIAGTDETSMILKYESGSWYEENLVSVSEFSDLIFADVNNDSAEDLVIASSYSDDFIGFYEGSDLSRTGYKLDGFGYYFNSAAMGDIDNDGDDDFVLAGNNISYWLENTGGSFAVHSLIEGGYSTREVVIGDVDDDGDNEIVLANYSSFNLILSYSGGIFESEELTSAGVEKSVSVDIGDIDNDGDNEIVFANETNPGIIGAGINQILYNSGGNRETEVLPGGANDSTLIRILDITGDLNNEIIIGDTNIGGYSKILTYTSSGFDSINTTIDGLNEVVVGDADNDGTEDIVFATSRDLIKSNRSGNALVTEVINDSRPQDVIVVDIDDNGENEIVYANQNYYNRIASYNGTGRESINIGERTNNTTNIFWADTNGNTVKELIFADYGVNLLFIEGGIGLYDYGTYYAPIFTLGNLSSRDKLYLDNSIPENTSLSYAIYGVTGGVCDQTDLVKNIGITTDTIINIDDVSNSYANLCLGVEFVGDQLTTPILNSRIVKYISDFIPTYDLNFYVQNAGFDPSMTLDSRSEITTSTAEITTDNNDSSCSFALKNADVRVQKTVDKAAVFSGDIVTYEIEYYNAGPYPAEEVRVFETPDEDIEGITEVVEILPGIFQNRNPSRNLGTVPVGSGGVFIVTGTVSSGVSVNDILTNRAEIQTTTYDPNSFNNIDTVSSIVGGYANVIVSIECDESTDIGETMQCTISYENNGNITASGIILTGFFDENVSFAGYSGSGCDIYTGSRPNYMVCDSIDLGVGGTGAITVELLVDNNNDLVLSGTILVNTVTAETSSDETSIGDNTAEDLTPIQEYQTAALEGLVFVDLNSNQEYNTGDDYLMESVQIFVGGEDIFGNTILPDKNIFSEAHSVLADILGFTDGSYNTTNPIYSRNNGQFFVAGLNPGTYHLYIKKADYIGDFSEVLTTGSNLGLGSQDDISLDPETIINITVESDDYLKGYYFAMQGFCGNSTIEQGEVCDDGANNGNPGMCNSSCQDYLPLCGNNILEGVEECDDGNTVSGDGCSNACTIETTTGGGSSGGGSSGGGGTPGLEVDVCPDGDYSISYYDNLCGTPPDDDDDGHGSAGECSIAGSPYADEMNDGYEFACEQGITTIDEIMDANADGYIKRKELAKMVSVLMVKVLGVDTFYDDPRCYEFSDIDGVSDEMRFYIETSCKLRVMGMEADGINPKATFEPEDFVPRMQFGTVVSRILFGLEYNIPEGERYDGACYYCKHLQALQDHSIMKYIQYPEALEIRGYAWIMFERIDSILSRVGQLGLFTREIEVEKEM